MALWQCYKEDALRARNMYSPGTWATGRAWGNFPKDMRNKLRCEGWERNRQTEGRTFKLVRTAMLTALWKQRTQRTEGTKSWPLRLKHWAEPWTKRGTKGRLGQTWQAAWTMGRILAYVLRARESHSTDSARVHDKVKFALWKDSSSSNMENWLERAEWIWMTSEGGTWGVQVREDAAE